MCIQIYMYKHTYVARVSLIDSGQRSYTPYSVSSAARLSVGSGITTKETDSRGRTVAES